jgi:hypothetical protein
MSKTQTPRPARPAPRVKVKRLADQVPRRYTPGTTKVHARYTGPPVTAGYPCSSGT